MVPDAALSFSKEIDRIGKAVDITASWVVNVQLKPCADNSSQMSIEGSICKILSHEFERISPNKEQQYGGDYLASKKKKTKKGLSILCRYAVKSFPTS